MDGMRDTRTHRRSKRRSSKVCSACGQTKGKSSRSTDPTCKQCARGDFREGYEALEPNVAAIALQGSPAKISVMAERAARGESLFRSDDGVVADLS